MAIKHLELSAASALTATAVVKYTVPVATTTQIRQATAFNSTASPVTLMVYIVPSAGSPSASNQLVNQAIAAGATYNCPELIGKIMPTGSTMQALGLTVTFSASGAEIV